MDNIKKKTTFSLPKSTVKTKDTIQEAHYSPAFPQERACDDNDCSFISKQLVCSASAIQCSLPCRLIYCIYINHSPHHLCAGCPFLQLSSQRVPVTKHFSVSLIYIIASKQKKTKKIIKCKIQQQIPAQMKSQLRQKKIFD